MKRVVCPFGLYCILKVWRLTSGTCQEATLECPAIVLLYDELRVLLPRADEYPFNSSGT